MKSTPCEYIVWYGLPIIRRGIAISMIKDYGLNQIKTAEKLGISSSAVSQYLSGKRGNTTITNIKIQKEFNKSAGRIIKLGDEILLAEICRLCNILITQNLISIGKNGADRYAINKSRSD